MKHVRMAGILFLVLFVLTGCSLKNQPKSSQNPFRQSLSAGWVLQDSVKVTATGKEISTPDFHPEDWFPATVPTTVFAALVANGMYQNIYYGKNLANIPTEPFQHSWWFRKEFTLSSQSAGKHVFLRFNGIVYRANVFLNGQKIASADTTEGVYRRFEFDVTKWVHPKKKNVLAVQVLPPGPGDPSLGFVDWNPKPPDQNLGLWQPVELRFCQSVRLNHPHVVTKLNLPKLTQAKLTFSVEATNLTDKPVSGRLVATFDGQTIWQKVTFSPHETRELVFDPEEFKELRIKNPKLWWPNNAGPQNLHNLEMAFRTQNGVSDRILTRFGIREVGSHFNKQGGRVFTINTKPILIRGGGWTDDLLLADTPEKLEAKVRYAKEMNLNAIRVEGIWGTDALYNLCDEYGLLMLVGWSCQWEWKNLIGSACDEYGGIKSPHQMDVVARSWQDQILRLRNHPSILVWLYGSDKPPRPELEKRYQEILKKYDPTRPFLSSATQTPTSVTGNTGVKMSGPYEWVPPVYWYADTSRGGAFSFSTEVGPGPEVPPLESVKKMIPPDHLWPIDDVWDFHCGRGKFTNLNVYTQAISRRYGPARDAADYCEKAQLINYEGIRAMYEAYARNKYVSTGVIQWMLNSAWPSMIWQLYDYYLMPGGAYFGAQKACEPVHIQYSYDDHSVVAINSTYEPITQLTATARVFTVNFHEKFQRSVDVTLKPDASERLFQIPEIIGLSRLYFLDLRLKDASGKTVSSNFYWLSTEPDVLDESKATWYVTSTAAFADFTRLANLPPVHLQTKVSFESSGSTETATVRVKNPTNKLAFFVELKIEKGQSGESVLPIYWSDNYFSLLPGEEKTVTARFKQADLHGEKPILQVSGWNVE